MSARNTSTSWSWESLISESAVHVTSQLSLSTPALHGAHGGYDVDLVGDEQDIDELLCDVCSKLLRDPRLTLCCGKHYCETCLQQWLEKQNTMNSCPQCRNSPFEHVFDKSKRRKVNAIKVQCVHKDDGCKWEGELSAIEAHLDSGTGCDYVPILCPNHCDSILNRLSLNIHLTNECELRPYNCKHCGYRSRYRDITQHYSVCSSYPVDCPKGCEKLIKRKNLTDHKLECAMEEVMCPFVEFGCYTQVRRKELEDHLKQETHVHLSMFMDSVQTLKSNFETLNTNMSELCAQLMEEQRKLSALKQTVASTTNMKEMRTVQETTWYCMLGGFVVLVLWLLCITWFK